ncbi:hypothetical protein MATL_G00036540 [Megalops atlanticus]|uniref:Zinc finger homeobox 2 n=1 Tax=Megalops atlanticus TaxID=7932 RepID=A0A9D3QEY2_MEGAT|nr:hypothetical protein MATL_G00036540 [Megalops atlanticus]
MQEESGDIECSESNGVLVWSCPLCQQGQTDRDALALHLTNRHSVLPACLDRLLDTAVPVECASQDNMEAESQNDIDASQQMDLEISGAVSETLETDQNAEGPKKNAASARLLRGSRVKVSCNDKEMEGEEEQEEAGGSFDPSHERTQPLELTKSQKGASNPAVDNDRSSRKNSAPAPGDPTKEKFLDPNRPFKCNSCLESFTSKSALSVHYSSSAHLQRMKTALSKQSGENDNSVSAQPNVTRPYISSKPYQCAVCRVSYNHAITLESHLKSVLHQTRSRNAGNSASSATGNSGSKGTGSCGNDATTAVSSGGNATQAASATTGNCGSQGTPTTPAVTTKDGEQIKPHPVLSLLSSPVASAQAVSAFLTLLTSSSQSLSPSLLPSLFTVNASASPATAAPQLIPQQQLLLPLFLNGLQAQNQSPNPESASPVLTQPVSVLGLNASQQALLAQRLSGLQSLGLAAVDSAFTQNCAEGKEKGETLEEVDKAEEQQRTLKSENDEGEEPFKGEDKGGEEEKNKGDETEGAKQGQQVQIKVSKEEEMEGKTVSEDFCKKIVQPNLNSPAAGNKIPSESPSPCNLSLPSTTSLSPINLNLTLSPDTTPRKSHTDTSPSHSSNPTPNQDSKLTANGINSKSKSSIAQSGLLNTNHTLGVQNPTHTNANLKAPSPKALELSEFQSQVLWAFLESRSEADAASPPQEDCEALALEVGLSEEEVRRWLWDARQTREKEKVRATEQASCKMVPKDKADEGTDRCADVEVEEEEGVLTIIESEGVESPAGSSHAIDLSNSGERERGVDSQGESCLDSDKEEVYTSVIVTDEESQNSSVKDEPVSPMRLEVQGVPADKKGVGVGGGKVLRSSTVFLSDAEDEEEDDGGTQKMKMKKRKREIEKEEIDIKRERQDPDVDLELEAQADPPAPLSVDQQGLPRISAGNILQPLPLSLSLTPFATQFISPYVVSLPASAVGLGINAGHESRGKAPTFPNPPVISRCSAPYPDPLNAPPPASHTPPSRFLPNGGEFEAALDLSIGKNHSSTSSASSSASTNDKVLAQRDHLLDGLGLRPTTVGVPGAGGLIVVRVKPESALAIPTSNSTTISSTISTNSNNNAKTKAVYIRPAERGSTTMMDRGRDQEREREKERERERRTPGVRRYREMRRSRTIIQAEQLDVLYGCYFKDPNPGKHEFEQISEWVHLPKKVVQIWFQNMRARERKGEVRFISDGTLAAVGKPLIKFTWPLTQPIFSSNPKPAPNTSTLSSSSRVSQPSASANPVLIHPKTRPELEQMKEKDKEAPPTSKPKPEMQKPAPTAKVIPKAKAASAALSEVIMETRSPLPYPSQQHKGDKGEVERGEEEEITDEEEEEHTRERIGPGTTNRMIPKQSTSISKPSALGSQKQNGLTYWSPKGPFKINTLSREQLVLSAAHTPSVAAASTPPTATTKSSSVDGAYLHHSAPRRPRTHLTSLQLSILQSCYETCAHPNALECETVGTELGLPLKVVQIWFQNTRAKEKRWRLQQEKQSPSTTDSKKVDISPSSYLQYSALRANRPILPKPVQLTVLEPSTTPVQGQPLGRETLRGRCEACGVGFESRAAARAHVFSPRHLATLRATNFGQPPSLVNSSAATGSSAGVAALSSSPSPSISTS